MHYRVGRSVYPRAVLAVLAVLAIAAGGCGKPASGGKPVTGQVTFNGTPIQGASITFVPSTGGAPGFAMTDAEGKYTARSSQGEGLPPGSYQVTVMKTDAPPPQSTVSDQDAGYVPPDPDAPPTVIKDLLPAKYKDVQTSGLTAEVKADGKNEFNFPLSD
jgi:hypothetical protein